jgi:ribonuclease R
MKINVNKDPFLEREMSKYANPIPSREFIVKYLEKVARPVSRHHLIKSFNLTKDNAQEALRRRLNAMIRDGQIIANRKGSYALVGNMALVRGFVTGHKDGFGFLVPDDGSEDIFLSAKQMRLLFPGDKILVSIATKSNRGKREGIVVEILERAFTQIVGRFFDENDSLYVIPSNKRITQEIFIPKDKQANAQNSQLVVANIVSYPSRRGHAIGEIVEVLGDNMAPGMEIEVAIRANGLPFKWSDEVLVECQDLDKQFVRDGRQELQHLPFVTIDGEDAKDFDDAVYCCKTSKGGWQLYVAIADVSHYVRFNSNLDQDALKRGNSVYFPQHVIPMLPEQLSNEVCSLKPNVERLCMVCEMRISESGAITSYKFYDAIIRSHARLTYDEVYNLLENKAQNKSVLFPQLQQLFFLYQVLLKKRKARGALEFASIETKIIFGKGRKIKAIEPIKRNYVHRIIEECMLAANVCASKYLLRGKIPALFRVHEGPDPDKLENLRDFLNGLGLKLCGGDKPTPADYAKLLETIELRHDQHLVQTVLLRSLRQAFYTPENIGHFGLAYNTYAHFTSPIRRYPDLLNHRAIRYLLHGKKVKDYAYSKINMVNFGEHCSMTERRADEATRNVINWLKCEYMQNKVGEVFDGIISGVTSFGVFVELKAIFVEGLLHITSLKNDYYQYDALRHRLVGKHSRNCYRLGDNIKILVARVNLDDREIDFELA